MKKGCCRNALYNRNESEFGRTYVPVGNIYSNSYFPLTIKTNGWFFSLVRVRISAAFLLFFFFIVCAVYKFGVVKRLEKYIGYVFRFPWINVHLRPQENGATPIIPQEHINIKSINSHCEIPKAKHFSLGFLGNILQAYERQLVVLREKAGCGCVSFSIVFLLFFLTFYLLKHQP